MSTTRAQRLVNLVICLRSVTTYLSAGEIRNIVQGYEECEGDEAFLRMFERDKKALRDVGVEFAQGDSNAHGSPVGYRIVSNDYELPEITLTGEQAGLLAVAAELWRSGERGAQVDGALAKLRAGGVDPVHDPTVAEAVADTHELSVGAALAEAVGAGSAVTFDYLAPGAAQPARRRVEPWWAGSREGRWYLVGHDLDRGEPRVFRLGRVSGVTVRGDRTVARPPAAEVSALLDRAISSVNPRVDARVWVAEGRAAELRAPAVRETPSDRDGRPGTELDLSGHVSELAALVAGHGSDAVALAPDALVERVHRIHTAAAEAAS